MDNKKPVDFKSILVYIGMPILMILLVVAFFNKTTTPAKIYSDILNYFRQEQVKEYNLNLGSGKMALRLSDNTLVEYTVPSEEWIREDIRPYVEAYNKNHPDAPMKEELTRPASNTWWVLLVQILPLIMKLIHN